MAGDEIDPHEALGDLVLTGIHFGGRERGGLAEVMSFRWRDSGSGGHGQSSHVRLALFVERGGRIVVEHSGQMRPIEVADDDRCLRTSGFENQALDPILGLPEY